MVRGEDEPPAWEYHQTRFQPPPGATEILFVRHGQSEPAIEGHPFPLVEGQGDPSLSPFGEVQAARLCARLAHEGVDAIYVSPLRRTSQSAERLALALGLPYVVEPDLREVFLGEWEGGLFRRMVAERDPLTVRMFAEQRWDVIPGAEPADVFSHRVRLAVERIAAAHVDQRVAAFTHGGTMGELLAQATGSEPFAFAGSDNASISHLVITPAKWVVRRFNDTAHLDGLLPESLELDQ
jgi:2,3-bisphosphoglycerate-dependent phosphoglycerate mutase